MAVQSAAIDESRAWLRGRFKDKDLSKSSKGGGTVVTAFFSKRETEHL